MKVKDLLEQLKLVDPEMHVAVPVKEIYGGCGCVTEEVSYETADYTFESEVRVGREMRPGPRGGPKRMTDVYEKAMVIE